MEVFILRAVVHGVAESDITWRLNKNNKGQLKAPGASSTGLLGENELDRVKGR